MIKISLNSVNFEDLQNEIEETYDFCFTGPNLKHLINSFIKLARRLGHRFEEKVFIYQAF